MPWWLDNNLRMIQNNLRDIDAGMDVQKWFEEIRASHCNCVMVGAGGISSFFPTKLPFQTPSPYLKGDLLGDIVRICHENGVRGSTFPRPMSGCWTSIRNGTMFRNRVSICTTTTPRQPASAANTSRKNPLRSCAK